MQSGLPVLANVNAGNDLAELIRNEGVGQVCESHQLDDLAKMANELLEQVVTDVDLPHRCKALFDRQFAAEQAVRQIVGSLASGATEVVT
jgi:hypothetical protein